MRSAGGRVQEPPSPHLQFRYPHCVPILVTMVLDRSHNLRMVREGMGAPRIRWGGVREALGALGWWGHAKCMLP